MGGVSVKDSIVVLKRKLLELAIATLVQEIAVVIYKNPYMSNYNIS